MYNYNKNSILSLESLKNISSEDVKNHFIKQEVIDDYHSFFNTEVTKSLKLPDLSKIDVKIFLTSFMVRFCPEQVMEFSKSNPKTKQLTEAAKKATIFFENFRNHITNYNETNDEYNYLNNEDYKNSTISIKEFSEKLVDEMTQKVMTNIKMRRACGGMISKYNHAFKLWQEVDNNELIQTLKISYHNIKYSLNEFERHKKEVEESQDHNEMLSCIQHMTESMGKIKRQYIHAQRRNGILEEQALEELEKITAKELHMTLVDLEEMILGAQNAFWDNFRKELTEDNFSRLPEILYGIKSALANIISRTRRTENDKIHNELESNLDENFDVDFIKQMIDNDVFEPHKLIGYVNYLSTIIKKLQAPEDDAKLEEWQKKVYQKLNPNSMNKNDSLNQSDSLFTYSEVLPDILRDIFQHISLINKRLEELRNLYK